MATVRPTTTTFPWLSLLALVAGAVSCAGAREHDPRPGLGNTQPTATTAGISRLPGGNVTTPSSDARAAQSGDADSGARADSDADAGPRKDCERRAAFTTMLGDDTKPTFVEWVRCGPHEAMWGDAGDPIYPRDRLTLTRAGEEPVALYSSDDEPDIDEIDYVEEVHVGAAPGAQIFYSVHAYGTGNIHDWKVVDRLHGSLRTWPTDSPPRGAPLIRADEHVGKQVGLGVVRHGSVFVETVAVYGHDDPNCCPTRGALSVEYLAQNGRLVIRKVWRHSLPP